jgi:hypothetical protein
MLKHTKLNGRPLQSVKLPASVCDTCCQGTYWTASLRVFVGVFNSPPPHTNNLSHTWTYFVKIGLNFILVFLKALTLCIPPQTLLSTYAVINIRKDIQILSNKFLCGIQNWNLAVSYIQHSVWNYVTHLYVKSYVTHLYVKSYVTHLYVKSYQRNNRAKKNSMMPSNYKSQLYIKINLY